MKFDIKAYRARWLELHHQYELTAYRVFKNALDKQLRAIISELRTSGTIGVTYLTQLYLPSQPMEAAMLDVYKRIGSKHGRFTYELINTLATGSKERTVKLSMRSEEWEQLMIEYFRRYGALRVLEIDQTTIEYIQLLLEQGRLQGLTVSQLVDFIVKEIGDPRYSRNRAMVIARTESSNAANYGAYKAGENSDYLTEKIWIGAEDFRERRSHNEQNGVRKRYEERYVVARYRGPKGKEVQVGTDFMLHPGDPAGSAENVIQCRCTIGYVPVYDEMGLPILK